MNRLRRALGVVIALASLTGLAALSRVPYKTHDGDRALLRLSWRVRGERIEQCRRATPAELANVPSHMRREVICSGTRVAAYRLRVVVDGRTAADGLVAGSGVTGDRPIYLLRDFELRPGAHNLQVAFEKQTGERDEHDDDRRLSERERDARRNTVPARMTLDTTLDISPGTVVLVTYDAELRRLHLFGGR